MAGKQTRKAQQRKARKSQLRQAQLKAKKRQGPVPGAIVQLRKRPIPGDSPDDPRIVWRFGYLDLDGPLGWRDLDGGVVDTVISKLVQFEGQTPKEIFRPGSGNKPIPAAHLDGPARKRLEQIEMDDLETIWELRLTGKQRIWGILQGNVFYVLWWDPNHDACIAEKRHT